MTDVYVIRNQLGHYWGKAKIWVDGVDGRTVLRTKHEDEAVNTLFELSSRDFELRGNILMVALSERGELKVEPSEHPLPIVAVDVVDEEAEHPQQKNPERSAVDQEPETSETN